MNQFVNKTTEVVYSEKELRVLFKDKTLPSVLTRVVLDRLGYAAVMPTPQPQYDKFTQVCLSGGAERDARGNWVQKWLVEDLSAEVIENKIRERIASVKEYTINEAQRRLDMFAHSRGYGGPNGEGAIVSVASYATSKNTIRQAEAQCCIDLRDAVWDAIYEIERQVLAGERELPNTFEDIVPDLPEFTWGDIPRAF
jgi:hypothetical protein